MASKNTGSSLPARCRKWIRDGGRYWLALLLAIFMAGCSTMFPYGHSELLLKGGTPPGDPNLASAMDAAREQRDKYLSNATEQTSTPRIIGAALIPLSVIALYKTLISPGSETTEHRIAGAGLIGSAAYMYGSTFTSKAQARIYLEGAEALSCAMSSMDIQYGYSTEELKELDSRFTQLGNEKDKLTDEIKKLNRARAEAVPLAMPTKGRPPGCVARPPCSKLKDNAAKALCNKQATRWDNACRVSAPPKWVEDPQVNEAILDAGSVSEAAVGVLGKADAFRLEIKGAGDRLLATAQMIQGEVDEQISENEPDLNAILSATQSLRGKAFLLTGSRGLGSGAGTAEAAQDGKGSAHIYTVDTADLRAQISRTRDGTSHLRHWIEAAAARSAGANDIKSCKPVFPELTLNVQPDVSELQMRAGSSFVFTVSGGSGTPRATASGHLGNGSSLEMKIDPQGFVQAHFKLSSTAVAGDQVGITFSDGSGKLSRTVVITVVPSGDGTPPAEGEEAKPTEEQRKKIYENLCVPLQGEEISKELEEVIAVFQGKNGLARKDGKLDRQTMDKILAMPGQDCTYLGEVPK